LGTSVNQRSPDTLNWRAVQATYEDASISIERVLQEIWRAASGREFENISTMLAEPIVFRLRDIALNAKSPIEAAALGGREIAQSKQTSLVADIALRAAVQAATTSNPAQSYSERVFAEASNYLISRDLPSFAASAAVREVGIPTIPTPKAWQRHAAAVVNKLRGKSR
jgi:hypothetical protein